MGARHAYSRLRRGTIEVGERFTAWTHRMWEAGFHPETVVVKSINEHGQPSFSDPFGKDWAGNAHYLTRPAGWQELDWVWGEDGSIRAEDSHDVAWSIHRPSPGRYLIRRDDDPATDSGDFRTLSRAMNGAEEIARLYWADVDERKKVERKQRKTAKQATKDAI